MAQCPPPMSPHPLASLWSYVHGTLCSTKMLQLQLVPVTVPIPNFSAIHSLFW